MNITLQKDVEDLLLDLNKIGKTIVFGGYLRDRLLNKKPNDVDIATNIPIETIEKMFSNREKSERRVTVNGHHIFSFKLEKTEKIFVEIVCTQNDLYKKAFEADYTLNSLIHNGKELIDLIGAFSDFEQKVIKEVDINIIKKDLSERPFLWLKTLRLVSITGFDLSENVIKELKASKKSLNGIIDGIFQTEGHKVLNGKNPLKTLHLLSDIGLINSNYKRTFLEEENSLPPQQKLCCLSILTSKNAVEEFIEFYKFPRTLKEKYEELYAALISTGKTPNRLKQQVIALKKWKKENAN